MIVLFFLTLPVISSEIWSTGFLILITVFVFVLEYRSREWVLFIIGLTAGIFLELGGDSVYKLQYWKSGLLLGIPLWLPVLWALAFVLIARIGPYIVEYTPEHKTALENTAADE